MGGGQDRSNEQTSNDVLTGRGRRPVSYYDRFVVHSVSGPNDLLVGDTGIYQVNEYAYFNIINNRTIKTSVNDNVKSRVRWKIKINDIEEELRDRTGNEIHGDKIELVVKSEWAGKELLLMPYLKRATDDVSKRTKVIEFKNLVWINENDEETNKVYFKDVLTLSCETVNIDNDIDVCFSIFKEGDNNILKDMKVKANAGKAQAQWEAFFEKDSTIEYYFVLNLNGIKSNNSTNLTVLSDRLTYIDIGLPENGPCYMRTLIAVAEEYANSYLSRKELKILVDKLTSGTPLLVDKTKGFYVEDEIGVVKMAIDALLGMGANINLNISITRPGNEAIYSTAKANAMYSLLNVSTRRDSSTAGHWQLGNNRGNFLWDSLSGKDNGGRRIFENSTRYVKITQILEQR